jgi:hypothetical protein
MMLLVAFQFFAEAKSVPALAYFAQVLLLMASLRLAHPQFSVLHAMVHFGYPSSLLLAHSRTLVPLMGSHWLLLTRASFAWILALG